MAIYGQQHHPHLKDKKPIPQPTSDNTPPSKEKLELLLSNGPDWFESVRDLISKHKLPYEVEVSADGLEAKIKHSLSAGELFLEDFITEDEDTLLMKEDARKCARTPYEVLITGETGTGKELIAKSQIADRKGKSLHVNCAGFPEHLMESELFGHVKGAFTGAEVNKMGMLEAARDGIFFLDEIGELPLHTQAKLLRAIQDKKIRRVGSNEEIDINCKFVCATHRDLQKMVSENTFRRDLYARISTLELKIKPLRNRMCDVLPIVRKLKGGDKFLAEYEKELMEGAFDLSNNVRSLQALVTRFSVLGRVNIKK